MRDLVRNFAGKARRLASQLGRVACIIPLLGLPLSSGALALDNDADDYLAGALPAGTNLAAFYYQFATRDHSFASGRSVTGGSLDSQIGILRYARFVEIGPFLADPQFLLPIGSLYGNDTLNPLGSATSVGDLILASTVWLHRNTEAGTFAGITPILYVPTGSYNPDRTLNIGENRWKGAIQGGVALPIFTRDLTLQISADVTFYGDNNRYGALRQTLSQAPLAQFQAWLKYNITKDFDIRFGTDYFLGGHTSVNGISNRDGLATGNIRVGFAYNFAPTWNVLVLYGRDVDVDNGFREANHLNVRLFKLF